MKAISTKWTALALALAVAGTVACGSNSTGPGGNAAGTCSITLSGSLTGSPACSNELAAWSSDDNVMHFGFTSFGGATTVIVSIGFTGEPTASTHRNTDSDAGAAVAVQNGDNGWVAQVASASEPAGSYTLTISSVSTISSAADGKVYNVHGTLTATLEADPSTSATGSVTLNATF